ncbi:hypothetical protein LWI29_000592 [Acer saccharum]|uniref:Uncharacterized protein n=1 Tax=Acer saccharum TaxID=4024 RepID=A0AA39V615_ACESA|nr:hypothetical protein LWI29_000592 [Acer saccharum]
MSSDHTTPDLNINWTPNDDDEGVDSRTHNVDRRVTIEDPSTLVSINARGMLEQGAVYAIALAVKHPEYMEVPEASTSDRPIGILNDSPASLVTEDMLPGIQTMYGIPDDVELRAPREHEQVRGASKAPPCAVAPERTKILLEIPVDQRSVSNLLTKGNFRPSRLWRWSALNRSRAPYPHVKDFLSYIWIRRSFEILQYNLSFLPPITDVERRFVVTSIASAEINVPDNAETMRCYRDEVTKKRADA